MNKKRKKCKCTKSMVCKECFYKLSPKDRKKVINTEF